jgi:hypothetical protein
MTCIRPWLVSLLVPLAVGCTPDTFETVDAAQGDGAMTGDAAGDAGEDVVCDGAAPFCGAPTAGGFCADFDESDIPSMGWSNVADDVGGYITEVVDSEYVSCPHSMRTVVPAVDGGSNAGHGWLIKDFTGVTTDQVNVSLSAFVKDGQATTTFALFEVRAGMGAGVPSATVTYNGGWQLHAYNNQTAIPSMPVGVWATFTLDVTFSAVITAILTINGGTPITVASTGTAPSFNQTIELALGVSSASSAPAGSYYFDNVTVQLP